MKINLALYLLCAFGGIAAYSLLNGGMYAFLFRQIGALRYKGALSARRERSHGILSGALLVAILVVYYFIRTDQGSMVTSMYYFVLLISFLTGRSIFPLIMSFFLPTGMYENGIVTSRGLVLYKSIKKHDIHDTEKPRDADVLFLRLYTLKSDYFGGKVFMFDRKDKGKITRILKEKTAGA